MRVFKIQMFQILEYVILWMHFRIWMHSRIWMHYRIWMRSRIISYMDAFQNYIIYTDAFQNTARSVLQICPVRRNRSMHSIHSKSFQDVRHMLMNRCKHVQIHCLSIEDNHNIISLLIASQQRQLLHVYHYQPKFDILTLGSGTPCTRVHKNFKRSVTHSSQLTLFQKR